MKKNSNPLKALDPFFTSVGKLTVIQRALIVVVSYALCIGGFVWFSYMPKMEGIDRMSTELATLEKDIERATKKAKRLPEMRKKRKEINTRYRAALKTLPEQSEIPTLLTNISTAGIESGLQFISFKPGRESVVGFYAEIPIYMTVRGDYHKVSVFFDKISRMSRIVNVKDISVSPQNTNKGLVLNTACRAVTYRFVKTAKAK